MIELDEGLALEIQEIRALVDAARLAVKCINALETETSTEVLLMAVNRLTDLLELENREVRS